MGGRPGWRRRARGRALVHAATGRAHAAKRRARLAAVRIASGPYTRIVLDTVLQPAIRDGDSRARLAIDAVLVSLREKAKGRIQRAGLPEVVESGLVAAVEVGESAG